MDDNTNIVELYDENFEEVKFRHIMTLNYNEKEYIVLSPLDDDTEDDEVVILRVEYSEDGNDTYVSIDDEEELEEVLSAVNEVYSTMEDSEVLD